MPAGHPRPAVVPILFRPTNFLGWRSYYDPTWLLSVEKDGGNRVAKLHDRTSTDEDLAQSVAADKPLWVANSGDNFAAVRFAAAGTEHLTSTLVPNASAGTIWAWFKGTRTGVTESVLGSTDATPDRCYLRRMNTGVWQVGLGGSTHATTLATTTAWAFVAFSWNGSNVVVHVDAQTPQSFVNTGSASTRAIFVGARDSGAGSPVGHCDGDLGKCGVYDVALTSAQVQALRAGTPRA
jgi:hypothetical protein